MTVLIKPTLACNLSCAYCYQNRLLREKDYDLEWILNTIEETAKLPEYSNGYGGVFTLHGGEPLTLPKEDIEAIFKKIVEVGQRPSIQTNGVNIDDDIIEIFKKYRVSVGVSIDGPEELNVLRAPPSQTRKVLENLQRLVEEKIPTSVIIVVHKFNAGDDERFEKLKKFIHWLSGELRITGRLNPLGYPAPKQYFLEPGRLAYVYRELAKFMLDTGYQWSPFRDIMNALLGRQEVVCVFRPCDPFNTAAAHVIKGDRMVTNCQRHVPLLRTQERMYIREEVLYNTPFEYGGCRGCKYFPICYGGCSATTINGDWRNRDANCPAWKAVFSYYDNVLRFMGIEPAYVKATLPFETSRSLSTNHTDGIEHVDGGLRHLDGIAEGSCGGGHNDGVEHTDGSVRHLDSDNPPRGGSCFGGNHTDGVEHIDGSLRHLDG